MRHAWLAVACGALAMSAACSESGTGRETDATALTDALEVADATEVGPETTASTPLGLNDISFLLPLPAAGAAPLVSTAALIPSGPFARLVTTPADTMAGDVPFVAVAVRFDLCDRSVPGPCPPEADGVMRVVLQPLSRDGGAFDVAIHAFYPIPAGDRAALVADLRALARLRAAIDPELAPDRPLAVNPHLVRGMDPDGDAYVEAFVALVMRHADPARLVRLTLFGQLVRFASVRWVFRGLVADAAAPDGFADIIIPDVGQTAQEVTLLTDASYELEPLVDAPAGFALTVRDRDFMAASQPAQIAALGVLAAIDNPLSHTPDTVQCAACHVTTNVVPARVTSANLGEVWANLAGRFTAPFDLSPSGDQSLTLRAFGYGGTIPLISVRVAAETANVLADVAATFP